jgi:tryptophan-rich sensory protein
MDQSQEINEFTGVNPYDYYNFYIKNSRLFGLVWFILTVCFTLALIIVFIQPDWVGDTQGTTSIRI